MQLLKEAASAGPALLNVPAAEFKTQTLPASPALGRFPKQTWRAEKDGNRMYVCILEGEGQERHYCNRKTWGLEVAKPKGHQLTPLLSVLLPKKDTHMHMQAPNTKQEWVGSAH